MALMMSVTPISDPRNIRIQVPARGIRRRMRRAIARSEGYAQADVTTRGSRGGGRLYRQAMPLVHMAGGGRPIDWSPFVAAGLVGVRGRSQRPS